MSLATKNTSNDPGGVRDVNADYITANLEQLAIFRAAGMTERANEVVATLRALGHQVDKMPSGNLERAVSDPEVEKAVPAESPAPKRRRAAKAE